MKNQAVSPVIAVVLLLLVTISVSYSAYLWINYLREDTESSSRAMVNTELSKAYSEIRIIEVNTTGKRITIRNTGGKDLHDIQILWNNNILNQTGSLDLNELWIAGYTTDIDTDIDRFIYVTTTEKVTDKYEIL